MRRTSRSRWVKIRRVIWIPLLTAVLAGAAATAAISVTGSSDVEYQSDLLLLVPATSPPSAPETTIPGSEEVTTTTQYDPLGRPTEALRAASNYAEVIPQDGQIRQLVATASGLSPTMVSQSITAAAVPDSSLILVSFVAGSAEQSQAGIDAIEKAVIGPTPATQAISPQSLIVVSKENPQPSGGSGRPVTLSAVVLGFAFGLFLAFAWAKSDGRVDSAEDLGDETDVAVVDVDDLTGDDSLAAIASIVWSQMETSPSLDGQLGVLSPSQRSEPAARSVVVALSLPDSDLLADFESSEYELSLPVTHETRQVTVRFGGVAGTPASMTASAVSNLLLLVVESGDRLSKVRGALDEVERVGGHLGAILIVDRAERDY